MDLHYKSTLRKLHILYQISKYVSSTLDLPKVLKIILTGVTFGDGFGFNRAYLFLADKRGRFLEGRMAVGPANQQDAAAIWQQIEQKKISLEEFLQVQAKQKQEASDLDREVQKIKIPIHSQYLVASAFRQNRLENVDLSSTESPSRALEPQIAALIDYPRFCLVPMACFGRPMGAMIVDNKYNCRRITDDDINFLLMLSQQATLAIENAKAYHDLKKIVRRLVNINQKINTLKEYNENILENIPIGICVSDHAYIINACNARFCSMAHKTRDMLKGRLISEIGLTIKGKNVKRLLRKVMHVQKNRSFERAEYSFGQNKGLCNLNLALFRKNEKELQGIIVIVDDITEKAKMEETLKEFRNLAQLGQLAAHVAHEIRNPLVAIGGYARRLEGQVARGSPIEQESLHIISGEVHRLENILSSTLQFSSQKQVVYQKFDLLASIRECIQVVCSYARDKDTGIRLSGQSCRGPVWVNGSPEQLKQALINLFKNSIEASYGGEAVKITVKRSRERAVIYIENKGKLIEAGDMEKIFLPFYSTKTEGTGLGLAVTKKIIMEHRGEIDVCSKKGHTVFTIKLPLGGGS